MSVRVRFAPSPTGPLHIGGVRTALFNYLFAKHYNGSFLLRIEDTDQVRYVPGAEEYIHEALAWLGLHPDEGPGTGGPHAPYRQSERREIYQAHAQMLVSNGWAYYAFDTPEELEGMRARYEAAGDPSVKYDAHIRMEMRNSLTLGQAHTEELLRLGTPYTIRFKVPTNEDVTFDDTIRGQVTFSTNELDDKVLIKTDGLPTYHLANVVDDHLMEITHVIRGEEWLSSTAHHVLLYRAFGWAETMPLFAHLPLIMKPEGQGKLSKRDGAQFGFPVFPLDWNDPSGDWYNGFREFGFLPDALLNFLALLGWNPGTEQELFDLDNLIAAFSLDQVSRSGARFDFDKALWFNQQYILNSKPEQLAALTAPLFAANGISTDHDLLIRICSVYRERIKVLPDLVTATIYLFHPVEVFDEEAIRKMWTTGLSAHFVSIAEVIDACEPFSPEALREHISGYVKANKLKMGNVLQMIRTAISGSPSGPDVFHMVALLDKEAVTIRIRDAAEHFGKYVA